MAIQVAARIILQTMRWLVPDYIIFFCAFKSVVLITHFLNVFLWDCHYIVLFYFQEPDLPLTAGSATRKYKRRKERLSTKKGVYRNKVISILIFYVFISLKITSMMHITKILSSNAGFIKKNPFRSIT